MSKSGRNMILVLCLGLLAGCAGIPVAPKSAKPGWKHYMGRISHYPGSCPFDPATGTFRERLGELAFAGKSLAPRYTLSYDSLMNGMRDSTGWAIEERLDGSGVLTDDTGARVTFIPNGQQQSDVMVGQNWTSFRLT